MSALTTPLKTAEGYYKRAFRVLLRARHPAWKESTMRINLAYLWASRTQAEADACEALVAAGALTLPAVDAGLVMDTSVGKDWVALDRSGGKGSDAGADAGGVGDGIIPATKTTDKVNTTRFAFWPHTGDLAAPIPNSIIKEDKKEINKVFAAGTLLPTKDKSGSTWHGAALLGEGAAGHVYLWLKTDENNIITDRMAIKDTKAAEQYEWIDATRWRDNLPREIALSQRLAAQDHPGIVGFRGYRLNMADRRSRLFLDYSDYGSAMDVLMGYYYQHGSAAANIEKNRRRADPSLPEPDYVPEAFIWYVFQSLVDILIVLRDGTHKDAEWKPIMHLDLCLANILAGPATDDAGKPIYPSLDGSKATAKGRTIRVRDRKDWPRFVLTDFDTSMFNLQGPNDTYQDNPVHYAFPWPIDDDADSRGARGRYAPERSRVFYEQRAAASSLPTNVNDPFTGEHNKYTSATDVWSVGQVIWCLLTNLMFGHDFRPKWDSPVGMDNHRHISDCRKYTPEYLREHFLTGEGRADVTTRYSAEIKQLVRDCVTWDMADRVPLDELKARVAAGCAAWEGSDEELVLILPSKTEDYVVGATWPKGKATKGKKRSAAEISE